MKDKIDPLLEEWVDDVEKEQRLSINYGSGDFYWDHLQDLAKYILNRLHQELEKKKIEDKSGGLDEGIVEWNNALDFALALLNRLGGGC